MMIHTLQVMLPCLIRRLDCLKLHVFGSGDHDLSVPFTGSQAWTSSIGYKIVDPWRPWPTYGEVAGYLYCCFLLIISH